MRFKDFLQGRRIYQNGHAALRPKVSVVMPTYCRNAEGLLDRCIKSVLGQTFSEFEFIIVDDGSTDGSQQVVEQYANADSRIVYVRHDINSGLPAVRTNEGILLARAPYVAFIFDDNIWDSRCLEKMLASMAQNPADVHYARTSMVVDQDHQFILGSFPLTRDFLQHLNTIPNGTTLCTKEFFNKYGLYDPHIILRRSCDWDLWLRSLVAGAAFYPLADILSTELGPSSPVSLGRSVKWDYKTANAYMTDEKGIVRRINALRPGNIEEYDVFDPTVLAPYFRSYSEWQTVEEIVYKPFFEGHAYYAYSPLVNHNRLTDPDFIRPALSAQPQGKVLRNRRRLLLVRNIYDAVVADWKAALEEDGGNIVHSCGEWQVSAFTPSEIDAVILFDCTARFLVPFVEEFRAAGIPVGYVVSHGPAPKEASDDRAFRDYAAMPNISDVFGIDLYFPNGSRPWPKAHSQGLEELMALASAVFCYGETADCYANSIRVDWLFSDSPQASKAHLFTNAVVYCGDPNYASADISGKTKELINKFTPESISLVAPPGESARGLADSLPGVRVVASWENLGHLPGQFPESLILLPDDVAKKYSQLDLAIIAERFSEQGCFLASLEEYLGYGRAAGTGANTPSRSLLLPSLEGQAQSLRYAYINAIVRGLFIKNGLLAPKARKVAPRCLIFLHSSLVAGSEVFGLMLAKLFHGLGLNAQVCVPVHNPYGGDAHPTKVNEWLLARGLPEALRMDYVSVCDVALDSGFSRGRQTQLGNRLKKLDAALVVCSGLMPEVAIAVNRAGIPLVNVLFQLPGSCHVDGVTFMRDLVAGVLSDSEWSAKTWRRLLPPPVEVVPSYVEKNMFAIQNGALAYQPVRIAIGGTVQPRKRQLEALKAIELAVRAGHDLQVNIYGYTLDEVEDYVAEIKQLAANSVLSGRVEFHGLVDMATIVRDNHILLSASVEESMPQTLLFAMAAGLVPVACPAGGVSEAVQSGRTGFLAKGFSVEEIAEALETALQKRDDWPEIIRAARMLIADNYSELAALRRLTKVLEESVAIWTSFGRNLAVKAPPRNYLAFMKTPSQLYTLANFTKRVLRKLKRVLASILE